MNNNHLCEFDDDCMHEFYPGTRIMVFDARLFVDDKKTPLSYTMRPATIVCWYGRPPYSKTITGGPYKNLIDVVFDYRPDEISVGHFPHHTAIIKDLLAPYSEEEQELIEAYSW